MEQVLVFTGGGSGGHVFPGLAIIEAVRKRFDGRIVWIGSSRGIERPIVEDAGIEFVAIPSGKLRRYFDFRNLLDVFRIAAGILASLILIPRLKPMVVFSKGGYVSVPPVIAARILGVRVLTHESDRDPGLATRINARFVDEVLCAYAEAAERFPGRGLVVGNPVRRAVLDGRPEIGRKILQVDNDTPVLFFIGGSLGARQINHLVAEILPRLIERFAVVHQCGREMENETSERYVRRSFIKEEYPHFLAAADLVISRAGANTLWELSACATPSLLLPLDTGASRGDQIRNAEAYAATGGAVVLDASSVDGDILYHTIVELFDDTGRLSEMAQRARVLGGEDAAERIAERILPEGWG